MLRAATDSAPLVAPLERAAAEVDLAIAEFVSMDDHVAVLLMPQRTGRAWLVVLAAVGLSLSLVGVYGLVSMASARMAKEIGIRRALGAEPGAVMWTLARRALWPVAIGLAGGSALAFGSGRYADRFMYGISGSDPGTIVLTGALLALAAVAAALVPIRRALRAGVVDALRME